MRLDERRPSSDATRSPLQRSWRSRSQPARLLGTQWRAPRAVHTHSKRHLCMALQLVQRDMRVSNIVVAAAARIPASTRRRAELRRRSINLARLLPRRNSSQVFQSSNPLCSLLRTIAAEMRMSPCCPCAAHRDTSIATLVMHVAQDVHRRIRRGPALQPAHRGTGTLNVSRLGIVFVICASAAP